MYAEKKDIAVEKMALLIAPSTLKFSYPESIVSCFTLFSILGVWYYW